MSKSEYFKELLIEEGYRPTVDEDGDISFKAQGVPYGIRFEADDPDYLEIHVRYEIDVDASIDCLVATANAVNARRKAVKVVVFPDMQEVWFTLAGFYEKAKQFEPFMNRVVDALAKASDDYFAALRTAEASTR